MKSIKIMLWILIALVAVFSFLFIYKQNLFDTGTGINAERFAHYSTFISLFFSLLTIGLLFYTFQQTRNTHQLAVFTFEQTKKDSVEATFFNLIQNYRTIVERLHNRITLNLRQEFVQLNENKGSSFNVNENIDKDFFELMYRMLHLEYKEGENIRDISKVSGFFGKHNWLMGHYFRNVLYFIKWVHQNAELTNGEKKFYVEFIQSQLTSDEMRLLFYFIISRDNIEKMKLAKIFWSYNFFDIVKSELIWGEDNEDWQEFEKTKQ